MPGSRTNSNYVTPGSGGVGTTPPSLGSRLNNVEGIVQAVLWVGIISLVAVVVSVAAMVIDQAHFNNQTYKDQSAINEAKFEELNARIDQLSKALESKK